MIRCMVTGIDGQVGWEIRRELENLPDVVTFFFDRKILDLTSLTDLRAVIRTARPHVIINCAAYTAVDKAESDIASAFEINGVVPGVMAEEAKALGALLVHYSTDYVFDGHHKKNPYFETDLPNPLSTYGRSKLEGEKRIKSSGCDHLILRTSWIYSGRGRNFLLTIRKLAAERQELRIINDQYGSPTWAKDIAKCTKLAIDRVYPDRSLCGTYNFTASGYGTWYDFAIAISVHSHLEKTPRIIPITTAEYPLPAARPLNSRLSNHKLLHNLGIVLPHWRSSTEKCIKEI